MAVQAAVAARWKEVTGCVLTQAWGLTETSPAACINPMGLEFNGIDRPAAFHRPKFRFATTTAPSSESTRSAKSACCGPQVMGGYWNRPDETEQVMLRGLAAHRRHRAHRCARLRLHRGSQEGHDPGLRLQCLSERDRERRSRSSRACSRSPAVAAPDAGSGEAVALFVVKQGSRNSTAEALIAHCRTRAHAATRCRSTCISAPICRRPTSARFCAARCATNCANPRFRRRPRRAPRRARPPRSLTRRAKPADSADEYARTVSTSTATRSGSTSGVMPWPRLNTWPGPAP